MDSPATPVFTLAAQPGAAAHTSSVAPTRVAEAPDTLDGAAGFAPWPASRKERLLRLLLASRQMQQR